MNDYSAITVEQPAAPPRPKRRWWLTLLKWLLGIIVALLLIVAGLVAFIDTGPGHRFITDRIAALAPNSGLRIRIGRIEGSIWGKARLRDVRLYDTRGLFAESPLIELDWRPTGWVYNQLVIKDLQSELVVLHRLPQLRPSDRPGPILPGFDIELDRLRVNQLRIGRAVTGSERVGTLAGRADIRAGRALVEMQAVVRGGGDRLALLIDVEPDRNRFDLDVKLDAPANSVAGAIVGTRRPMQLAVEGEGTWSQWRGSALLDLSGQRAAQLAVTARSGRYRIEGVAAPARYLSGLTSRLTAPRVQLAAEGTFQNRRIDGRMSIRSAALRVEGRGIVDLARSSFTNARIAADLTRPEVLVRNATGRPVQLALLLNGPFRAAGFVYRLSTARIAFGATGFDDVVAQGRGRMSRAPVQVPIRISARRVTGVGDVAGGILGNLSIEGVLRVTGQRIIGDGLALRSDKLNGRLGILVDLATGRYDVVLSGGLNRFLIPGLGVVDVLTQLKVVPGPGGRGTLVTGRARVWVRRLDNAFFRSLTGGLPYIEANLVREAGGIIRFSNLRLTSPSLRLTGSGFRRNDGTFYFEGRGNQATYGPLQLTLDGNISRPRLAIRLARPMDSLGLRDVALRLEPTAQGFAYRAEGQSMLGPFTSNGAILLPSGAPVTFQIAELNVSGTRATGSLRSEAGGFAGRLDVAGGGLDGQLLFAPVGGVQRIEAHLAANGANFAGPPPISIRRGRIDAVVLLTPGAPSVEATITARGLRRGGLSLANLDATARMRGGTGQVRATFAGSRGRAFSFQTLADVTPDAIRISGSGTIDRRPIELTRPAVLTRLEGGGWRLSEAGLRFAGGNALLSGQFGGGRTDLSARVEGMPLNILDLVAPDLGLGGIASGTLSYSAAPGALPSGAANMRIRGLTRAGLVLTSTPIDVGVNARLANGNAAMRALAVSQGRTIGRAQARLTGVRDLGTGLTRAPLFAQLRFSGPADSLWRLTGIELFDLSGPVAVGADVGGTLDDPVIRGSMRAEGARLESALTGTVVTNIRATGRFGGSRFLLDNFTGSTPGGGTVSGRGAFDLAAARGFGIDLAIQAEEARVLGRDDITASVTGPIRIRSDGAGGTISGNLRIAEARYRLGRATAGAAVPRLPVRELNRPDDEPEAPAPAAPWRLDLALEANNRFLVQGLGIDSEWSADLDVEGTVTSPVIRGRLDLVRGGYEFAGRRFDLERGVIRFVGNTPINPVLDIRAEGGIQGLNAVIRVTGTGLQPDIAFSSTPALPEDELLSRLLFGTSITNLSAPEALQLAAAVAALQGGGGGGLDPINAIRGAIGLDRLRILPADVTTGQSTAIAAGKYIGDEVYAEVITDGRGYSATRIEYQITRWLSILGTISTIGRQSVNVRVSRDY